MSHFNAPVLLVWTVLSALLGAFFASHLWAFDHFKCLKWNQGSQGTFKRVMTYSYLFSLPLIFTYSLGNTIIKYQEGMVLIPEFGVVPKPYQLWSAVHRSAILPLTFCYAFSVGLEVVSHLEETCFWLYVVNAGPSQKEWFSSVYFKAWVVGSLSAIVYVPLTTFLTRNDVLKCEAATFLAGALGSGIVTFAFVPVLYMFPGFLRGLKKDGVDMETIVRLTKFHELNTIRVFFRLLFVLPIWILSLDGLTDHHVNENQFATDFLAIIAGFGITVSSGITLTIFFPRSVEGEIARDTALNRGIFREKPTGHYFGLKSLSLRRSQPAFMSHEQEQELYGTYNDAEAPVMLKDDLQSVSDSILSHNASSDTWRNSATMLIAKPHPGITSPMHLPMSGATTPSAKLEPNRRMPDTIVEADESNMSVASSGRSGQRSHRYARARPAKTVSHFVHNFRSPIDFRRADGL